VTIALRPAGTRGAAGPAPETEFTFTVAPPLSLYIHLPWCVRKCPYCDFNSYELNGPTPEGAYVAALIRDLDAEASRCAGRTVGTVFMGGGTPSLFSAPAVAALLDAAAARVSMEPGTEITLEANPGTFDQERFAGLRRAGVNRLSIGIQSLDDEMLGAIGRIHSGAEAVRAFHGARAAGFDNINVDLMYGLPGQTVAQARRDLHAVMALDPEHISHYQLTVEPRTRFYHQPPPLPDDEVLWDMQVRCQADLAAAGYEQYEVSAYALPGRRCRHNLNYWQFGDYLGVGAGAHGKLTDVARGVIERAWKVKHPNQYLRWAGTPRGAAGTQALAGNDAVLEFMLNAMRLRDGFPVSLFQARTGLATAVLEDALKAACAKALVDWDGQRIRPTAHGRRYLNDLLQLFIVAPT
jgi:putative oxygen-independent coproporphyrinogen III oxidase